MKMPYLLVICLFGLLGVGPASAHEVRPAYLELHEAASGEFAVLWKTPMLGEMRLALSPEFSGRTENLTRVETRETGNAAVQTWRLKAIEPLRGQSVRIAGLEWTMTDALVRAEFADGTSWTQRLTPSEPAAVIPARQSGLAVAGVYLTLGVEHILFGIDHLLFVLALLIITKGTWRLVKTVSAFTVAHSITLALATLDFVHVPRAPVEAVIALSIVFVATEIVHARRGLGGITARAPWIVAFTFGLLHGFGFAGALNEIGLPQGQIPVALLFFNLGVEAGQLLFIAAVLGLMLGGSKVLDMIRDLRFAIRDLLPSSLISDLVSCVLHPASRIDLVTAYAIGSVAMFWVIQRAMAF